MLHRSKNEAWTQSFIVTEEQSLVTRSGFARLDPSRPPSQNAGHRQRSIEPLEVLLAVVPWRVPETVRIMTVRETAWFNVDPETTWSCVSRLEDWSRWCAGLGSARWIKGDAWKPGSRFELNWDGGAPSPYCGGEVLRFEEEGNLDRVSSEDATGILVRRICWRAGFGPFQSEARMAILEDGSGSLIEFVTLWQGWAAHLGGLGRASRCAKIQRDWLASLKENMERVGSIG